MYIHGDNISKNYIRKNADSNVLSAVKPCSIELRDGEMLVIKGRSGSGKSTLLSMLSGILIPSEGSVFYDDKDIYSMNDKELSDFRSEHIGMIPQGKSAISSLTVYENVVLPFTLFGLDIGSEVTELMDKLGIADLRDVRPEELSGGELRRMAIARSLVRSPEVIFADEPTGDLDDENTRIVLETLRDYASGGKTVLMVTHDSEAFEYADRTFRMDGGELVES